VLRHRHAAARHHKSDGGGNVEGSRVVAAGAAGIHQLAIAAVMDDDGVFAHGASAASNLGDGLALCC